MTERRKDLLALAILLGVLILFFSPLLFTTKIIRAPDILNEFYWTVKDAAKGHLSDLFRFNLRADWDLYQNSGDTTEGGWVSQQFLLLKGFIFLLIPAPASIAWYIVLHLFFGAAGVYCYCRAIGTSRLAALLGGAVFALVPEHVSLINAGHVLKIATISFAPWVFYFFEKGFLTRRLVWFLATAVTLAFQFFHGHWQIAYYTCLAVGGYGVMRIVGILLAERGNAGRLLPRLLALNLATLVFFLTTVAISLLPLANWSVETNRGVKSGANQGRGGLQREEAMSWSMPPEELATFVIPGFFGFSRQEGGENPGSIRSYYWGRMNFTQTIDYMGLLPWLLVPLPLVFRRDRYTWLAVAGVAGAIIFSLGQYSFIYQFLFDHFPGINRFRVPKMMMFVPVLGLGVLAARGLDCLLDAEVRATSGFRRYVLGLLLLPLALLLLLGTELAGRSFWLERFADTITQPTRYEQGAGLVAQRWGNIVAETAMATVFALLYGLTLFASFRRWLPARFLPLILLLLFVADVGRVNGKFMLLVDVPEKARDARSPVIDFLARESKEYRVLPMGGDPMPYAASRIPVMFTSRPVQQQRWQEVLDAFTLSGAMTDMLNVKYLIVPSGQYEQEKGMLGAKYREVFRSPDKSEVVLENLTVLPKGWLVPAAAVVTDSQQTLALLQSPGFDPRRVALVESTPPIPMADPRAPAAGAPGTVAVTRYEGERVEVTAEASRNSILVLGDKYAKGWRATVDRRPAAIYPVDRVLRGVYLAPGRHAVEFAFDPISFRVGKYLTLGSFALFSLVLLREILLCRRKAEG
jgi:hypothetical protein